MSAPGFTPIQLYYSTTASAAPSSGNLANGELALNITDGKLYYKDNGGVVRVLAGTGGTGVVAGSNTQVQFNNNGVFGASSGLTWDGTNLTASQLRSSGLTSGRVTYASTSGLLVDSANMTFNGTRLTVADLADSGLTSGRVVYSTAGGALVDSANLLYSGTDLTVYGITVGRGAGAVSTNTAVGASALAANTTGTDSTAVGRLALSANTTGSYNAAFGAGALYVNTTGSQNTALGVNALVANTAGASNVAVGMQALTSNTTASNNTAVGYQAGYSNTTGAYNSAFGPLALYTNSTASANVAIGYKALYNNNNNYNTAIGAGFPGIIAGALEANTTGTQNVAIGSSANANNSTGSYNTVVGVNALGSSSTGSSNVAVGNAALNVGTGSNNTAVGYLAGQLITTGSKNTIIGGYNGNQGGLDIRTASNVIVLSDGDGNPQLDFNPTVGAWHMRYEAGSLYTYQANQLSPTSGTTYDMLTGIPNGTYLLSFDANGTYHYGGVWIYRHYDSADKTVTFLGGTGYGAAPTISDPSNTYNSGTVRVVPNQNYSSMAVRLWRLM